jgi:CDGSH-type Zn-finger protein/uncharacterized Fe-S cluster protein YjdI
MIRERIIRYKGEKITVLFSVDRCTHYAACLRGAPEVFDSRKRPWVLPDNAPPEKVSKVIMTCPTGALHFERKDGGPSEPVPSENILIIEARGPVYLSGQLEVKTQDDALILRDTRVAFCRCGLSRIKPFCDNTHNRIGFEEAASSSPPKKEPGIQALPKGRLVITLMKDGPIRLSGPFTMKDDEDRILHQGTKAALCRCGASKKMPFCDGSHRKSDFHSEVDCVKIL